MAITIPCSTPKQDDADGGHEGKRQRALAHPGVAGQDGEVHQGERGDDHHGRQRRLRKVGEQRVEEQQEQRRREPRPTRPVTWLLAPDCSATAVREPLVEIAKPWKRPAAMFAAPIPIISLVGLDLVAASSGEARRRRDGVGERHERDPHCGDEQRSHVVDARPGHAGVGKPCGSEPTVVTPLSASSRTADTTVAPTTATSTAGTRRVKRGRTSSTASTARPTASVVESVWSRLLRNAWSLGEEPVGVGREAEELRQLAHDDGDGESIHVADLHLAREQVGNETELAEPESDHDEPHHHAQASRPER